MSNSELSKRIKDMRTRAGFSQEELAEVSGLSLRTVQRIENGESDARGDSLKRLAAALGARPEDLLDWPAEANRGYLSLMNLSALSFLLFPLLGVLIPFIMWSMKKGKIRDLDPIARALINFQLTWCIVVFLLYILCIPVLVGMTSAGGMMISMAELSVFAFIALAYIYNLVLVLSNSVRITNDRQVRYIPGIRFIRN